MMISELQTRVEQFDKSRGWDRVEISHIGLHICEEAGEIARALLSRADYKNTQDNLGSEISDLVVLLSKLCNTAQLDLQSLVEEKLITLEARFPVEESKIAMENYLTKNDRGADSNHK